jgi:hypothetical protein
VSKVPNVRTALFFLSLAIAGGAAGDWVIPIDPAAAHEIRLRNASASDGALAMIESQAEAIVLQPGGEIVVGDVTADAGEIRIEAPAQVEVRWRRVGDAAWRPAIETGGVQTNASARRRRSVCFGCRVEVPTLVRPGDFATFSGPYGVSGRATIVDARTIRLSEFRANGTAPGIDIRVGLSTTQRRNFAILRVTGRQTFQNATLDLTLPDSIDLNAFDTFTVYCFEFSTVIAEGKFRRP